MTYGDSNKFNEIHHFRDRSSRRIGDADGRIGDQNPDDDGVACIARNLLFAWGAVAEEVFKHHGT